MYIPPSKLPNKTILTVRLLLDSSAKEQYWKLSSGPGFLLTLASGYHQSTRVEDEAKSSKRATKMRLSLFSSPLVRVSNQLFGLGWDALSEEDCLGQYMKYVTQLMHVRKNLIFIIYFLFKHKRKRATKA